MDIPRIPSQNRPHDDKNVVQFTNSTESRSSVASRDYLISDSIEIYAGLVAPAGTPSVAVERLRKASQELVVNEEYLGAFRQTGLPEYIDGPAWATAIQRQYDQWGVVIKEAGIKPN